MVDFKKYFYSFYGVGGLYSNTIPNLTEIEYFEALLIRKTTNDFAADSFDREAIRDIILESRKETL